MVTDDLVVASGVGLQLEHEQVAIRLQALHVHLRHRHHHPRLAFPLRCQDGGRVVLLSGLCEQLDRQVEAALDRGDEQLTLGAEQAEHVRLRDADAPRDPVDWSAVKSGVGELVDRRLDQRVPAL
jgi:hypothetical protein